MNDSEELNIAYGLSLVMKNHGKLTKQKAVNALRELLKRIEDFVDEDEFWELCEIEETIELMEAQEFEGWKKLAQRFFVTRSEV